MGESPKLGQRAQRDLAELKLSEIGLASVDRTAHTQPAREIHCVARHAAGTKCPLAQRHGLGCRKIMFAHQRPGSIAERHARVHRMSRQKAACQYPLTAWVEQPCQLFEKNRHALLVAVGAGRADGEDPQRLGSPVER